MKKKFFAIVAAVLALASLITLTSFASSLTEVTAYNALVMPEKTHFEPEENITVALDARAGLDITNFEFTAENLDVIASDVDGNRLTLTLSPTEEDAICRINVNINDSDGGVAVGRLFAYNTAYGAFVNTASSEEARESWFAFALGNGIMTGAEYFNLRTNLYLLEDAEEPLDAGEMTEIGAEAATPTSNQKITITYTLKWTDDNGDLHNVRGAKVCLYRLIETEDGVEYFAEAIGETDDNGRVQLQIPKRSYPISIHLECRTQDSDGKVTVLRQSTNQVYLSYSAIKTNVTSDCTDTCIFPGPTGGSDAATFAQAMQIFQAAKTAADFAEEMLTDEPTNLEIIFPHQNHAKEGIPYYSPAATADGVAKMYYPTPAVDSGSQLSPKSYASWDAIMHEYGHHVAAQQEIGILDSNTPGGSHDFFDNLTTQFVKKGYTDAKERGIKLAWSEAWASIFALIAQDYYKDIIGDIPFVADRYFDAYTNPYRIDIELDSMLADGEDAEGAIMEVLWDLRDGAESIDGVMDQIQLQRNAFWDIITEGSPKTFSDFAREFYDRYGAYSDEFGVLLSYNHIAPYNLEITNTDSITLDTPPTFNWAAGGAGQHFPSDSFVLLFYDELGYLIFQTDEIYDTSYTLSEDEWDWLLYDVPADVGYSVVISALQTDEPVTGEYLSKRYYFDKIPTAITGGYILFDQYTRYEEEIVGITAGDSIEYTLYTGNAAKHVIQTTSGVDTMIEVYRDGTLIAADDDSGYETNAYLCLELLTNEAYTVVIRRIFDDAAPDNTRLIVTLGADYEEFSAYSIDTYDDLKPIYLDSSLTMTDTVSAQESRLFKFIPTASGEYNFNILGDTEISFYIIDPRDTTVATWGEDFEHSCDYYIDFTYEFEEYAEYLVMITFDPYADGDYSYTLEATLIE